METEYVEKKLRVSPFEAKIEWFKIKVMSIYKRRVHQGDALLLFMGFIWKWTVVYYSIFLGKDGFESFNLANQVSYKHFVRSMVLVPYPQH